MPRAGCVFEGTSSSSENVFEARKRRPSHVAFSSLKPASSPPRVLTVNPVSKYDRPFLMERMKFDSSHGHPAFHAERSKYGRYGGEIDFAPKATVRFPVEEVENLSPFGPYELPPYTSSEESASGIGEEASAPASSDSSFWSSVVKRGKEVIPSITETYSKFRKARRKDSLYKPFQDKPLPPPLPPPPPPQEPGGMSSTTIALLIAGGVIVAGTAVIFLLRRR